MQPNCFSFPVLYALPTYLLTWCLLLAALAEWQNSSALRCREEERRLPVVVH